MKRWNKLGHQVGIPKGHKTPNWGKKGQFYLTVAAVTIALIIVFVSVYNNSVQHSPKRELDVQGENIFDYGEYDKSKEYIDFIAFEKDKYSEYLKEGNKLYFAFTNSGKAILFEYSEVDVGSIRAFETSTRIVIENIEPIEIESMGKRIEFNIRDKSYSIEYKEDFYVILGEKNE